MDTDPQQQYVAALEVLIKNTRVFRMFLSDKESLQSFTPLQTLLLPGCLAVQTIDMQSSLASNRHSLVWHSESDNSSLMCREPIWSLFPVPKLHNQTRLYSVKTAGSSLLRTLRVDDFLSNAPVVVESWRSPNVGPRDDPFTASQLAPRMTRIEHCRHGLMGSRDNLMIWDGRTVWDTLRCQIVVLDSFGRLTVTTVSQPLLENCRSQSVM